MRLAKQNQHFEDSVAEQLEISVAGDPSAAVEMIVKMRSSTCEIDVKESSQGCCSTRVDGESRGSEGSETKMQSACGFVDVM
jgi:hypothetical protein